MERNPVSVLMEHAQDSHVEAEFRVLISLGTSHQPRFLCQWVFNKTPFPAWFSSSKKDGKQKAALLTLEGLRLRPTSPRVFVFFVSDGLPTIYVERSSAADIDPRYFMGEPFTSTVEAVAYGEQDNKVMNYEPGKNELKPRPPKPLPRTPPKAADNAPKKMQAFDDDTIAALANRNGAFITNISCVTPMQSNPHEPNKSQQPATLPQPFRPPAMRQSLRIAPFQRAAASYSQAVVAPSQRAAATNGLATIAHQDDADTNGLSNEETDLSLDLTDALTSLKDKPIMSSVVTQQAPLPLTTSSVDLTRNQGQNPISALYELGQKKGIRPDFSVLSESGPPHQRTFVCKCSFGAYEETVHASSKNAGRHDSFKAVFEMVQNETPLTNGATPTAETSSENSGDGAEKNPISAVMELGNKLNILPEFECRQLSMTPLSRFEGYCVFGQRKFGPVVEQNKKRAKTAAFEKAWEFLTNDPFTTTELAHHQHSIVNSLDENSSLNVVLPPLNIPNGRGSPVDTESMYFAYQVLLLSLPLCAI